MLTVLLTVGKNADVYDGNVCVARCETRERARLFAAAPQMREALEALINAEWMVTHDWGGDRDSVLIKAHAALRAASGEKE